jgi:hypothetical protein
MEEIVGSRFKPDNAYGQNGSSTPSSVPVKQTPAFNVKNPAAALVRPRDPVLTDPDTKNWQTRTVSATPFKAVNKGASRGPTIPAGNNHAASKIAPRGNARR